MPATTITYDGVVFQQVPDVTTTSTPEWNTLPTSPICFRNYDAFPSRAPVHSPPNVSSGGPSWQGPSTDQQQEVQMEIRWPASVTASLERMLIVVDYGGIPQFVTEPVELAPTVTTGTSTTGGWLVRGYGYDITQGLCQGYGWNWTTQGAGGFFYITNQAAIPDLAAWTTGDWSPFFVMAHDHFAPLMIQPIDLSPQIHDPADGGGYFIVDGTMTWPAGTTRPTPYLYLPQWSTPPPSTGTRVAPRTMGTGVVRLG